MRQVLHVGIAAAGGQKRRQRLAVALHAVDKVALVGLVYAQRDCTVFATLHVGGDTVLAQLGGHGSQRGLHLGIDKVLHVGRTRALYQLAQALLPVLAAPELRSGCRLLRLVALVGLQPAPQAVAQQQHDGGEGQGAEQGHGLQCFQAASA